VRSWKQMSPPLLFDNDRCARANEVGDADDIPVCHANASRGLRSADGARAVGAVDANARFCEANPEDSDGVIWSSWDV